MASSTTEIYFDESRQTPMWHLALGWIMVLPLLFFSTDTNLPTSQEDVKVRLVAASDMALTHRLPIAISLLIIGGLVVSRFQLVLSMCKQMKLLLALPILALVSCLWSENARQSVISAFILLVFTFFSFYIVGYFGPRRQLELIMLVGGVLVPLCIAVALIVPGLGAPSSGWRGILGHKNNLGIVATLLLVTALHWSACGLYQRMFRAIYVAMCILLIIMSKSRTGWALACIALCLTVALRLLQRLPFKESFAIALAALPVSLGLGYAAYQVGPQLLQAVGKDPTLTQRTIIWAAVWDSVEKHLLLGYGYSAFWTGIQGPSQNVVLVAGWALAQAQNGFLDLWLQLGIVSIVFLAIMLGKAAKDVTKCFRGNPHGQYVRWCVIVLVCILSYNVGESSLGLPRLSWLLFLMACAGLSQVAHPGAFGRTTTVSNHPNLEYGQLRSRHATVLEPVGPQSPL